MLTEEFRTLAGPGTAQTRVLGSRFSARAFALTEVASFESILDDIKKINYDSSHHCWASIERGDTELIERQSDAGEPKGTAGLPILQEIKKQNLENCAVVVTRWFGGTKLGTGGLVRAYSECAALSLADANIIARKTGLIVIVHADYDLQSFVYQLAAKNSAVVDVEAGRDGTRLSVKLRANQVSEFIDTLRELSAGKLIGKIGSSWTS